VGGAQQQLLGRDAEAALHLRLQVVRDGHGTPIVSVDTPTYRCPAEVTINWPVA
jgi:hypothetical protein